MPNLYGYICSGFILRLFLMSLTHSFWLLYVTLSQLAEGHGAPDGQEHARLPARLQGQNFIISYSLTSFGTGVSTLTRLYDLYHWRSGDSGPVEQSVPPTGASPQHSVPTCAHCINTHIYIRVAQHFLNGDVWGTYLEKTACTAVYSLLQQLLYLLLSIFWTFSPLYLVVKHLHSLFF